MVYPAVGFILSRNYWEHIIRSKQEHAHIAEYINNNPAKAVTREVIFGQPLSGHVLT